MSAILPYKKALPRIADTAFLAENAVIIGDVEIGEESNIWFGCTLRGDVNNIIVGARVNIQDHTMIHVSSFSQGTYISDDVTVGHCCLLHACTIEKGAFIGMQSCIMDDAKIEERAMVAAGSLVTPGKTIPSGQLWGGSPARYMRDLTEQDYKHMAWTAKHYVALARNYDNS